MKSGILAVTLLALSACASILRSNAPASQVYLLRATPAPVEKSVATPAAASLQVALP